MGRKSLSIQRRAEIIENFCAVAEEVGVEKTSLAQVAKKMGINVSLTLHYFKSKDELLVAVCEYILQKYSKIFCNYDKQTPVNKQKILDLIDTLFSRDWNTLVDDGVFYGFYSMIFRIPVLKKEYKKIHDSLHQQLAEILTQAKQVGLTNLEDPLETAISIFIILDGWYYQSGMMEDKALEEKKLQNIKDIVYKLLHFN